MDLREVQTAIETAAATPDPLERVAKIRVYRELIEGLRGLCDSYLADDHLRREAESMVMSAREAVARENATLREELVRRELATAEDMDEAGMLTHRDLDHLAEEGLLEAALDALYPLVEDAKFDEKLHPRGRGGKWTKGFAHRFAPMTTPTAKGRTGPLRHPHPQGKPPDKLVVPPAVDRPKGQSDPNKQKVAKLADRIKRRVKLATSGRRLSTVEAIFNAAGSVSQHTLLQFVRDAASKPDTMSMHSTPGPDGKPKWKEARRILHEKIIDAMLREPDLVNNELVMNPDNPYLVPDPDGQPKMLASGGGYAAGKGGSIKLLRAEGRVPAGALTLDPDRIKAMLPEYQDALNADDPEGNLATYREAWEIAQEVQRRAQEKKLNVIVDGVSNTTVDEMLARIDSFHQAGYVTPDGQSAVTIVYTDIPTEEALNRAAKRAATATADADRRHIPEIIMRAVHRDVAATIPALLDHLAKQRGKGPQPRVEVFDNNQGWNAELGKPIPPKRYASFDPSVGTTVEDQALWDTLQQKSLEQIPGVEPGATLGQRPASGTTAAPSAPDTGTTTIGATWAQSEGPQANYSPSSTFDAARTDLQRSEHQAFRASIPQLAEQHGVQVSAVTDAVGYYRYSSGSTPQFEPSLSLDVAAGQAGLTLAAEIGRRMKQDSVMHFTEAADGPDQVFTVKGVHGSPDEVLARATDLGIVGATIVGDSMHFAAHADEAPNVSQALKTLYDEGRFKGGLTTRNGHLRFIVRNQSAKWRPEQETYANVLAGSKERPAAGEAGKRPAARKRPAAGGASASAAAG